MKILMLEAVVRKELHNVTLCARFLCMSGFGMRKLCTLQSDEIGYWRSCYVPPGPNPRRQDRAEMCRDPIV